MEAATTTTAGGELARGCMVAALALILASLVPAVPLASTAHSAAPPPPPRVALVAADEANAAERTMPLLAAILERTGLVRTSVHLAEDPAAGEPDPASKTSLTDPEGIATADGLVAFVSGCRFDPETLAAFLAPTRDGKPLTGIRSSIHGFRYPDDLPVLSERLWNRDYGARLLGTPWRFDHGESSRTRILPPAGDAASHPLLRGISIPPEGLLVRSPLYQVEPLARGCRVLLWGEAVESARPDEPTRQPIAWVREVAPPLTTVRGNDGESLPLPNPMQRIAVTTLGHPEDLESPAVRRLAAQLVLWSMSLEDRIPEGGIDVSLGETAAAPPDR